ncbi:MAG TPA: hypothetical protein VME63_12960 [Dyella sp.]|uniref:hypothetical protein n=1 Tax=Dyella sp. TaxID=1869338 RepID=UPI002C1FB164|nr:hypothetical protein [Dyella sp.]HTV86316.1 hypothetical protein [Dyella sp.]
MTVPIWRRWLLFASLLAVGGAYVAVYAFFVVRSENFIVAQDNRKAAEFGGQHPVVLPASWTFGKGSPDDGRLGFGWRTPFPVGAWMAANDAWIVWIPEQRDADLILTFDIAVFTTPASPRNRVEVSVNGKVLGSWERGMPNANSTIEVRVPHLLLHEGACSVRVHIDHLKAMYRSDVGVARNGQELVLTAMTIRTADGAANTP